MATINRIIPFGIWPAAWGLKGKSRDRAEAEYYNDGYELDMIMAEIDFDDSQELEQAIAKVKLKYDELTECEFAVIMAEIEYNYDPSDINEQFLIEAKLSNGDITEKEHDYAIAELRDDEATWLGVKHKHGEITTNEFGKEMATLRGEPWVIYEDIEIDKKTGNLTSFGLDWNKYFIEVIKEEGHVASSDEGCVDLWLTQMSRNIALEELHGTGVFDSDAEESYELKKKRMSDGKSEYK